MQTTLVIPVLNEVRRLTPCIRQLARHIRRLPAWQWEVVIADNGSTDRTWELARELEAEFHEVRAVRLERPGRGGALRDVWFESEAALLAYSDVDLSTDLEFLPELLTPLSLGGADLATGSRLVPGSSTKRGWRRELLSRGYNVLARALTGSAIHDHQCGFKALTRSAALALLPHVQSRHWFFDTELLVQAQWRGWRVREVPVRWVENSDSRVRILKTISEDLRGLWRLRRRRAEVRRSSSVECGRAF